jgi:hypothetical protein
MTPTTAPTFPPCHICGRAAPAIFGWIWCITCDAPVCEKCSREVGVQNSHGDEVVICRKCDGGGRA